MRDVDPGLGVMAVRVEEVVLHVDVDDGRPADREGGFDDLERHRSGGCERKLHRVIILCCPGDGP